MMDDGTAIAPKEDAETEEQPTAGTIDFKEWCDSKEEFLRSHRVRVMTARPSDVPIGIRTAAAILPSHYVAEKRVAHALARLGKAGAAKLITELLPDSKSSRSGDLGEILATELINVPNGLYRAPIKRLRWRDHRIMAMRGDDVIGFFLDQATGHLLFLKCEAKSRASLDTKTVAEARAGLDQNGGRPSPHSLTYIATRLFEMNDPADIPLIDAIDEAGRNSGIPLGNVKHLIFTFSGNSPEPFLKSSIEGYAGSITQWAVGLHVKGHAAFVKAVYDQVIADANRS